MSALDMRAVLFDFDGVVVDSTPLHLRGWEHAYLEMFQVTLEPEVLAELVGRSTSAIGRILAERSGFPMAKAELVRRKTIYIASHIDSIQPIKGIDVFLKDLRKKNIPYGIVSNAPREFILNTLKHLKLDFPFVLGLENYQRPKPDAEPYMKGAQKIGSIPFQDHRSIFVFEDSTHGLEAAIAAHMTPIGICSQHPPSILTAAGAIQCFQDMEEALSLFSNSICDKS